MNEKLKNSLPQTNGKIRVSKKQFKQIIMPPVGTILANHFHVDYVNYGKFRITASFKDVVPKVGDFIKIDDRMFGINSVNLENKKFYLTFRGFDEGETKPVPEAPEVEINEDVIKLI